MNNDEWVSPTDQEDDVVARKALMAAREVIDSHMNADMDQKETVALILRAFGEAQAVVRRADKEFAERVAPKKAHSYYLSLGMIVASALAGAVLKLDVPANSLLGHFIEGFAAARHALDLFNDLDSVLSEGTEAMYGESLVERLCKFPQLTQEPTSKRNIAAGAA